MPEGRLLTRRAMLATAGAVPLWGQTSAFEELASRKTEAKPVSIAERLSRMERARQLMHEHKMNAILVAGGSSLFYFTGVQWGNSERLLLLVLPAKGEPFFICPAFEEGRLREQAKAGLGAQQQVFSWQEDESPYTTTIAALKERGLATGRLGLEETVKFVFSDGVGGAASNATLTSATPVTAGCRAVKSDTELALMKLANQVTLQAYEAAWKRVSVGMTNPEFGALIAAAHAKLGFPGSAMVLIDDSAALPHGSGKPQRIKDGSIVLLDGGCSVEGYKSDISRTFVVGKPTEKMNRVFELVRLAQQKALAAARPGAPCQAVDAAARAVITEGGFGPGYRYFTHRLGHGIGLDGHEWPYLVNGNTLALAKGMTFSDEPGIYLPGEFGVRLEDILVIRADGAELLTPPSKSLEKPFQT